MNRGKIAVIVMIVLIILLFFTLNNELFLSISSGDIQSITSILDDNIVYTLFVTFIVMFVHNAFPIIPLFLVILINNTLFGFQWGLVWSLITSILCAVIVFLSIRNGIQAWMLKKVSSTIFSKVEQHGLWYVFLARIFPFAPSSVINGVSGVSNIRFSYFTIATVLGNSILFSVYTLIQAGLLSQGVNEYVIGSIILVGSLLYYFLKKFFLRKNARKKQFN